MKILTDALLLVLYEKYSRGENISKKELDVLIESCKKDHENNVDNEKQLTDLYFQMVELFAQSALPKII